MTEADTKALIFAEKLLGVAIDVVGAADVRISAHRARDPKIIALTLLCRTITNFKGAMIMARENLIVESRTLTRCCYENLIWIGALRDRGLDFVQEMLNDETANRKALGELTFELTNRAGATINEDVAQQIRTALRNLSDRFPNRKKLNVNKTAAQGPVELAYILRTVVTRLGASINIGPRTPHPFAAGRK
jgi:hypothetical protein